MTQTELKYGSQRRLAGVTFEQALEKTTASLNAEGFGVLTTIDVRETLKKKLGVEVRRYVILRACNPPLAHKALAIEPHIGLLLPCNVVVQEESDGGTVVSIADPKAMFSVVDNSLMIPLMEEADARLQKVMQALA